MGNVMVFLKLSILIISAVGAGLAAFELNNFSKYKYIYNDGVEKLKEGNYKAAEKAFKKVYEMEPDMEINIYNLGLSYFYLEKFDLAIKFFMRTIELNPQEVDAYYNIGVIHYLRNNTKDTVKYMNKALELSEKRDEQTLFCMTLVYSELQDYDMAIQSVSRLIELHPSNIDYRMLLADIYEKLIAETGNIQSVDFAIKTYQEILEINEKHEGANIKIANCFAQKGDIDSCKSACQQAIVSNPKSADALQLLGVISFAMQEFEPAISYFEQAYTAKPNLKVAYLHSAYAYAKTNNNAKAVELYGMYKGKIQLNEVSEDVEKFFGELEVTAA
jgi:tetratricopeptide (TPR) repeat protein